jgi:hypothetical protein
MTSIAFGGETPPRSDKLEYLLSNENKKDGEKSENIHRWTHSCFTEQ